jgi:hypothetical protein
MFLAGPKFKNPPSCKPSSDFRPFDPGIITYKAIKNVKLNDLIIHLKQEEAEMKEFLLPYGKEKLTAKIEDEHLAGVLLSELHSYKAPKSGAELVQDALEHPIGTPRLCDMAVGKKKVVVISSDHTRPVPSHIMMPLILAEIRKGNPDADITILISTGLHRTTTKEELPANRTGCFHPVPLILQPNQLYLFFYYLFTYFAALRLSSSLWSHDTRIGQQIAVTMIAAVIWAVAASDTASKVASTAATDAGVAAAFPAVVPIAPPTSG